MSEHYDNFVSAASKETDFHMFLTVLLHVYRGIEHPGSEKWMYESVPEGFNILKKKIIQQWFDMHSNKETVVPFPYNDEFIKRWWVRFRKCKDNEKNDIFSGFNFRVKL